MSELDQMHELVAGVSGWLARAEGELLYRLAKACPAGSAIVEIGSYEGKSTIWLGTGSVAGHRCPIYAIDPHTGSIPDKRCGDEIWTFDRFNANMRAAAVDDLVMPILATSDQASGDFDHPIGLIFVDGEHEYPFVLRDCREWLPKVIEGGVAAFHDTMASTANLLARPFLPGWDGPKRVFAEQILASKAYSAFGHAGTISYATKASVPESEWRRQRASYLRSSRGQRALTRGVTVLRNIGPVAGTIRWIKRRLGR